MGQRVSELLVRDTGAAMRFFSDILHPYFGPGKCAEVDVRTFGLLLRTCAQQLQTEGGRDVNKNRTEASINDRQGIQNDVLDGPYFLRLTAAVMYEDRHDT